MHTQRFDNTGRWLYAGAVLAIGLIHFITRGFPAGLLPAPGYTVGAFISGALLVAAALYLLISPDPRAGLCMAMMWLLLFLCIHLVKLLTHLHDGNVWTGALEVLGLCGGGLIAAGGRWRKPGLYLLAFVLLGFGVLHFIYLDFIVYLIPAWWPAKVFFAWVVMLAFVAASISIASGILRAWGALWLGIMFSSWVVVLHLPRVIANVHTETEWTSLCVASAMAGIGFMIYRQEILAK